jgi:hypothetical protein
MSDFPPVLTPERIEAMLSGLAELCFAGAEEAGARLKAAEDAEAFERVTRALQTHSRNLRQTLAMKQRFDRHQARMAAEARREAQEIQQDTPISLAAVSRRYRAVRNHMRELIWTEYEENSWAEALEDLDGHLAKRSGRDPRAFLDAPLEDLIADLSALMEMGEFRPDPDDEDPDEDPDDEDEEPDPPPQRVGHRTWPPQPEPALEAAPEPEPEPPPRPPDPPPEPYVPPYIPPWEKLKPGQSWPGSSGW